MHHAPPSSRAFWAYVGPFGLFALLLGLPGLVRGMASGPNLLAPEFWVYPLQTLLCGTMLCYFWREYPRSLSPVAALWGAVAGLAVIVIWISPQVFFHVAPRLDGFNPTRLLAHGQTWRDNRFFQLTVGWRFLRLAVVVPWLEEVFWRGFLLRYLIKEDFLSLPFGSWTPLSFGVVTAGFMLEHSRPDWPAALVTGILYNLVAVRTRSLPACVLAHGLTNLLLGLYVMRTGQWGFW